jgi:hypothetical protein
LGNLLHLRGNSKLYFVIAGHHWSYTKTIPDQDHAKDAGSFTPHPFRYMCSFFCATAAFSECYFSTGFQIVLDSELYSLAARVVSSLSH